MILQFKIALQGVKPEIWRELHVDSDMGMDELHYIIQTSMFWSGQFAFTFEIGGKRYGEGYEDDATILEAAEHAIGEIFTKKGDNAVYDYDGTWQMDVSLIGTSEPVEGREYPFCAGGARNSPIEECGSPEGYDLFLAAINDPKNEDREELLESVGGEFDPEAFDPEDINEEFNDPDNWEDLEDGEEGEEDDED